MRGTSINDVTVLGGEGQGFCDGNTKALDIKKLEKDGVKNYPKLSLEKITCILDLAYLQIRHIRQVAEVSGKLPVFQWLPVEALKPVLT